MEGNCAKELFRTRLLETIKDNCKCNQGIFATLSNNFGSGRRRKKPSPGHPPETDAGY